MKRLAFLIMLTTFIPKISLATEGLFYNLRGDDSIEQIKEKLKIPKESQLPYSFKEKEYEITLEQKEGITSLKFTPPYPFNPDDNDLFERIESNDKQDIINVNMMLSNPDSGRILNLSRDFKINQIDLIKPWKSKIKRKTISQIIDEMKQTPIKKMEKKK